MDQIVSQSTTKKCIKHSQKKIKFVQVNDVSNSQDNHLFYCTTCINKDLEFKGINYLLISQIIDEGQTNIIQKWPPVNDYSILDKLIQHTEEQNSSSSIIHQINQYFTHLKEDFLRKIDLCEKKMINRALELPLGNESILKQYQDISQISKLRSILIEGENKDSEVNSQLCRSFITEIESQKERNSEKLSNLLKQSNQKEQLVNFEYPNQIKDSIFSFIDQIDFFNSTTTDSNFHQSLNETTQQSNASKIMKLISNKSNFCSEDFLSQIQVLLERINPILSSISFENMHQQNKSAIDFSALSEQRFEIIKDLVDHQTQIEKSNEYSQSIKTTLEYKHLENILDSNVNFININLKEQLKEYVIDSYPLLKLVNFSNAAINNDKFDCFRSLTDIEIEDIFALIQKRKTLDENNQQNSSQIKSIMEKVQNMFEYFENSDEILRKYPILDLMIIKEKKEKPLEIKLTKTNYQNGNNYIDITLNKQVCLLEQSIYWLNCVSDIILEKEKKYIFRFSIESNNGHYFYLGLMQQSKCVSEFGDSNYLSCRFFQQNNQIQNAEGYGIDKYLRGDKLRLSKENEIEMRVWLGGQQLELLDYPNYQYQLAVQDKYKNKLLEQNDLKLYIGLFQTGIKVVLTQATEEDTLPI